jgi:transposase
MRPAYRLHWDGIVAYLETRLTNGPAEAINGIIQLTFWR